MWARLVKFFKPHTYTSISGEEQRERKDKAQLRAVAFALAPQAHDQAERDNDDKQFSQLALVGNIWAIDTLFEQAKKILNMIMLGFFALRGFFHEKNWQERDKYHSFINKMSIRYFARSPTKQDSFLLALLEQARLVAKKYTGRMFVAEDLDAGILALLIYANFEQNNRLLIEATPIFADTCIRFYTELWEKVFAEELDVTAVERRILSIKQELEVANKKTEMSEAEIVRPIVQDEQKIVALAPVIAHSTAAMTRSLGCNAYSLVEEEAVLPMKMSDFLLPTNAGQANPAVLSTELDFFFLSPQSDADVPSDNHPKYPV